MSSFIYSVGLGNAGSYIVSGVPYVKNFTIAAGAEETFNFDHVTKSVTVYNHDSSNSIRVHLATKSTAAVYSNKHYYEIAAGGSAEFELKCKTIYISSVSGANVSLFASLTRIKKERMYPLSGVGIDE